MQAMQVDEALEYADEWIKGVTVYEGAQGWRVACATLAAEVRRLRAMVGGAGDTSQKLIDRLEMLEVQAVREIAPGWIGIPAIEWDLIMGPNVEFSGGAPLYGAASAGTQG